jgi:hypothetical protein
MVVFTVTISAAGSPNPIKIPATVNGERRLEMIPPAGHAWTLYDPSGKTGAALTTDQAKVMDRVGQQSAFLAGETVASANLDTGSGTLTCILL